jgi:putative transposase
MARPRRILFENAVYHVTSRGNERQDIFEEDKDRWAFLRLLEEAVEEHRVLIHAWVLMDNHYHLVVETPEMNLPVFMARLNGIYTIKFNKRRRRAGHLFQGRYKSIHVDKDNYLKQLCRYVVLNPVRAKLCDHPGKWKWSSYRATAGLEEAPKWLSVEWVLGQFGRREKAARKTYRQYVLSDMKKPERVWDKATNKLYLGGEEFLAKMEGLVKKDRALDVPKYQRLIVRPKMEEVLKRVARVYGLKVEDLRVRKRFGNEAGDAAVYLLKREYGYSLKEIGKWFGIGFSGAGNRWHKMKRRVAEEKELAGRIEKCRM